MDKTQELSKIARQINQCKDCPLYKQAVNSVPGEGNAEAEIFFIGEGPGYYEDQQGRPFVGAAGQLLAKMLAKIGLKREKVFISNMIKHRPPENRDPEPRELSSCKKWLDRQLDIINPKIVVTLGRFSMAKFIPDAKISQIHGQPRFSNLGEKKVLVAPMYHPAAALRNDFIMNQFCEDFLRLPEFLQRFEKLEKAVEENGKIGDNEKKEEMVQMSLL